VPSLVIPPGYAQVFLRWTLTGDTEEMLSGIGVRLQAGVSDPVDIAEDVTNFWLSRYTNGDLSGAYTMVGARCYVGSDGDYPVGEFTVASGGGSGATVCPSNCAMLIKKLSALGGRRNRGRMFIPPGYMSEANVDHNGFITPGTLATLQSDADNFYADITSASTLTDGAVIFHTESPTAPTLITSLTVAPQIATMRQRMRK